MVVDSQKLDVVYKKIVGTVTETSISGKGVSNEIISSPYVVFPNYVWGDASSIPLPASGASTSVVTKYEAATAVQCKEDSTVANKRTWFAINNVANPITNANVLKNWVAPYVDPTYLIKVYAGNPFTTGVQLNPNQEGYEFFFDYSSGCIHFPNGVPASVTADGVWVEGYRYVGTFGSTTVAITSINSLTASAQTLTAGNSGVDVNVDSTGSTHTINIPDAGASARGVVTTGTQTFAGNKTFNNNVIITGDLTVNGTTVTLDVTNLDVEDKNISVNKGGTTAGTIDAGINILGDADAIVGYFKVSPSDNTKLVFKAPGDTGIATLNMASGNVNVVVSGAILGQYVDTPDTDDRSLLFANADGTISESDVAIINVGTSKFISAYNPAGASGFFARGTNAQVRIEGYSASSGLLRFSDDTWLGGTTKYVDIQMPTGLSNTQTVFTLPPISATSGFLLGINQSETVAGRIPYIKTIGGDVTTTTGLTWDNGAQVFQSVFIAGSDSLNVINTDYNDPIFQVSNSSGVPSSAWFDSNANTGELMLYITHKHNSDGTLIKSGDNPTGGTYPNLYFASYSSTGYMSFESHLRVNNKLSFYNEISPAQITANQNDYAPTGFSTAVIVRINSDASRNITGLAAGYDGEIKVLFNNGTTNNLVLTDEDILSSAVNRFDFGGTNFTLQPKQSVVLRYDTVLNRWVYLSSAGSSIPATVVKTDQANVYGDFDQTFRSNKLRIANPANTFFYSFTGAAIAADRIVTLPLLASDDTLVTEAFAQTLTNKTITFSGNTLTNVMSLTTAQSVTAGIKKTFTHDATNAGFQIGGAAGDPSSLSDGDIWYNTTTNTFRKRQNGVTSDLDTTGGTGDFADNVFRVSDNGDSSKKIAFEVSSVTTATTRTYTILNTDGYLGITDALLTANRIPYATGAVGLLTSNSSLIFDGTTFTAGTVTLNSSGEVNCDYVTTSAGSIDGTTSDLIVNSSAVLNLTATTSVDINAVMSVGSSTTAIFWDSVETNKLIVNPNSADLLTLYRHDGSNTSNIRFYDTSNSIYIGFRSPSTIGGATSVMIELPGDEPSTGDILSISGYSGGIATTEWINGFSSGFFDNIFNIKDDGDDTKKLAFEVSPILTSTTRTVTALDTDGYMALTNSALSASRIPYATGSVGLLTSNANFIYDGSFQTINRSALGATTKDGLFLQNATVSTGGATVQVSPRLRLSGTVWDTGASNTRISSFTVYNGPVSGNPGVGRLIFESQYHVGGYAKALSITNDGRILTGTTTNTTAMYNTVLPSATDIGIYIKAAGSPSANIIEVYDSADALQVKLDNEFALGFKGTSTNYFAFKGDTTNNRLSVTYNGTIYGYITQSINGATGSNIELVSSASLGLYGTGTNGTLGNVILGPLTGTSVTSNYIVRVTRQTTTAEYVFNIDWAGGILMTAPARTRTSELIAMDIDTATNAITVSTGYTTQRFSVFRIPQMSISTSQTVTNAATVYIEGAPSNIGAGTLTNAYSLWVDGGLVQFDGDVNIGGSLNFLGSAFELNLEGLTTGNINFKLTDNLADALTIGESTNPYLRFVTTNSSEVIQTHKELNMYAATNGNVLTSLQSTGVPKWNTRQNTVNTTNSTATVIQSITTATDTTFALVVWVTGHRTGGSAGTNGDCAFYMLQAVFKNVSGTVTQVGTDDLTVIGESQAGWTVATNINSTAVEIKVTGATDNNISWYITKLESGNY